MSKKSKKLNTLLLKKIRVSSRERYLARLSLGSLRMSCPRNEEGKKFRDTKIKNLENTIKIYTRVFSNAYRELLQRGVSPATIDDHLFYNWECRG